MPTYTGTIIKDLDITTPTEGATPPKELNDADREIKKVLKNTHSIVTVTGTYTALSTDEVILCNSASAMTVNIPQSSTVGSSTFTKRYLIININTGVVTLDPYSTETINGSTTKLISTQYSGTEIFTNGSNWFGQSEATVSTLNFAQLRGTIKAVTSGYTALVTDEIITMNSPSSTIINLYAASGNTGRILIIMKLSTGALTLDANGTELIDGALTHVFATFLPNAPVTTHYEKSIVLYCTGTGWITIANRWSVL